MKKIDIIHQINHSHGWAANRAYYVAEGTEKQENKEWLLKKLKGSFLKDEDISEIYNFTDEDVWVTAGMGYWTKTGTHSYIVFTPTLIAILPDDFELTCVLDNDKPIEELEKVKVKDCKDLNVRFGYTAWGMVIKRTDFSDEEEFPREEDEHK